MINLSSFKNAKDEIIQNINTTDKTGYHIVANSLNLLSDPENEQKKLFNEDDIENGKVDNLTTMLS